MEESHETNFANKYQKYFVPILLILKLQFTRFANKKIHDHQQKLRQSGRKKNFEETVSTL